MRAAGSDQMGPSELALSMVERSSPAPPLRATRWLTS